jgi:hypothetical protein
MNAAYDGGLGFTLKAAKTAGLDCCEPMLTSGLGEDNVALITFLPTIEMPYLGQMPLPSGGVLAALMPDIYFPAGVGSPPGQ